MTEPQHIRDILPAVMDNIKGRMQQRRASAKRRAREMSHLTREQNRQRRGYRSNSNADNGAKRPYGAKNRDNQFTIDQLPANFGIE